MKTIFLAIIFCYSVVSGHDNTAPYVGKWQNVSKTSPIKEVLFFPDNKVKFSSNTHSFLQRYSLSPTKGKSNRFSGFFKIINVGKLVKQSKVELKFLGDDIIELKIDDDKIILKRD